MPINTNPILSSPDPAVASVLQSVSQPLGGASKFRRVLGGVAQGVGNIFMPGVGTAIGSLITGGAGGLLGGGGSLLGPQASQMLQYQQQMLQEQQSFELASTILKNRNDATMSAIRNMKAS